MGIRGELFTTEIHVENRTYFFNVKENRLGDVFLQIVESKSNDGAGFDRHAIVVFEDEMQTFLQGLNASLGFVEKNRKEKLKMKRAKAIERAASFRTTERRAGGSKQTDAGHKKTRKVHVVKREAE